MINSDAFSLTVGGDQNTQTLFPPVMYFDPNPAFVFVYILPLKKR